jgi:hypothetical protein
MVGQHLSPWLLKMENKNKETKMNPTRVILGTIKIAWGEKHTLALGINLPAFLAEALHGKMTPPDWDEAIGEFVLRNMPSVEWSGHFNFPAFDEKFSPKGSRRGKGVGGLYPGSGLDQGSQKPAVPGTRGVGRNGRGLREFSVRRGVQKVSAVKTGDMARKGHTGLPARKNTKRVVSPKRIKALAGFDVSR